MSKKLTANINSLSRENYCIFSSYLGTVNQCCYNSSYSVFEINYNLIRLEMHC